MSSALLQPRESGPVLRKIPGVTVGRPAPDLRGGGGPCRSRSAGCDEVLPDGGLPRGAVVELASPYGLATATSIALAACASAQAEAKLRGGEGTAGAWCAWIEPAPRGDGAADQPLRARGGAGGRRSRAPPGDPPAPDALARVAVRVAESRVFSVIVIDLAGVPGRRPRLAARPLGEPGAPARHGGRGAGDHRAPPHRRPRAAALAAAGGAAPRGRARRDRPAPGSPSPRTAAAAWRRPGR